MPRFTQAQANRMLSGGGAGFGTAYTVTSPTPATGTGWHTKNWYDAASGLLDGDYHTLTIGSSDTAIPFQIPNEKDAIRITVAGVADDGSDLDYVVKSIEEMNNGFRRLVLSPPFVSQIIFPTITIANQTAGVESTAIALSATGAEGIMFSIYDTTNTRARIANSNLFVTGQSAGEASITLYADTTRYRAEQTINFQVS